MRCLALAACAAIRDADVRFVSKQESLEAAPALVRSQHPVTIISSDEPSEAVMAISELAYPGDVVVVDGYEISPDFEQLCHSRGRRVLVVDDLADRRRDCDWLLNAAPGVTHIDYQAHVSAETKLLLGPRYAPVHPGFRAVRDAALARRRHADVVRRILVAFGGTDPANATSVALEALAPIPNFQVDVALGASALHLDAVKELALTMGARVHVDAPDVPALVRDADLAIGAGGTSLWERCVLGLPSIIVTIASNQVRVADLARSAGAALVLGDISDVTACALRTQVLDLCGNIMQKKRMVASAFDLVDGLGASRVLDAVLQ